jgi:predicted GNAT family N-acyltransferase
MKIEIRKIPHASPEYALEVQLRNLVLRAPLGLALTEEELAQDVHNIHIGAFRGDTLIGCLLLLPMDEKRMKVRQVAVSPSAQGLGLGRQLMDFAEALALSAGFREMSLHARESVVKFYLKSGYEIDGEPFVEVSIPHRKMKKNLK